MRHHGIKPLNFVRSIPADGATDVSPNIRNIVLFFDNSFDHRWEWRRNRGKIQVWEGTRRLEKGIDYRLIRSSKRKIIIRLRRRLAANTEYTVAIFPIERRRHFHHISSPDRDIEIDSPRKTIIIKFKTGRRRVISRFIEE